MPPKPKAVNGVVDVVQIPTGVAVLAKDFWTAKKGRDALKVEWDESAAFKLGSDEIIAEYHELAKRPARSRARTATPTRRIRECRARAATRRTTFLTSRTRRWSR